MIVVKFFLSIFFLFLLVFSSSPLYARLTSKLSLYEKVEASEIVFIGAVLSVVDSKPDNYGALQYAKVKVIKVIKGKRLPRYIYFVTQGYSAETNPACCENRQNYLFFAKRGYPVMVIDEKSGLTVAYKEQNKFASAVNGVYSTYVIQKGFVYGWDADQKICSVASKAELKCVLKELESVN